VEPAGTSEVVRILSTARPRTWHRISTPVMGAWGESSAATGIGGNQADNSAGCCRRGTRSRAAVRREISTHIKAHLRQGSSVLLVAAFGVLRRGCSRE
jgi:hypothetical protein